MQPTAPPWAWVTWERRGRHRAAPGALERDKYAFYGVKKASGNFIRLDPLGMSLLLNREWPPPTSAAVTWRVNRFHDAWRAPDIKSMQSYRPYEPAPIGVPSGAGVAGPAGAVGAPGGHTGAPPHGWGHAARGWAAGAVVLALLVLIVRAAENCLHKKLFKAIYMHTNVGAGETERDTMRGHYHLRGVRRQDSDEWSTPNVTATSQQHNREVGSLPPLDEPEAIFEPSHLSNDLPPPYSECTQPSSNDVNKYTNEEPPPPYSACYVSYTVPKDRDPEVHIQNIFRQNILDERANSSIDIDNVQNVLNENGFGTDTVTTTSITIDFEDADSPMRTQLVFDNGRIVERVTLDLISNNNDTGIASNNNVELSRAMDVGDRVTYVDIDDNVTEKGKPENILLV